MNQHYTYFLILAAALAGPLLLSFDKKVAFYKKWKYLFPAMLLPAAFYIVWDICFTAQGIWSFNENYIIGIKVFNLPIEEVFFFFVVPYCCVFIYECIRSYFPQLQSKKIADTILKSIAIVLLIIGVIFYKRLYTSSTFILTEIFIACIYLFKKYFKYFGASLFLVSYIIILLPFLAINGLLTSLPVVEYNNVENLGIRVASIPIEDIFYGMLLILMNVTIYEKLRSNLS
jgi:lycopene cyclase domain-containing protein